MIHRSVALLLGLLLTPSLAAAAPCELLNRSQRARLHQLSRSTLPYACCDETLDRCLKQRKVCTLARRLRDQICRLLAQGRSDRQIKTALDLRARSMTVLGTPARIDLSQAPPDGQANAPVALVVYACARCPLCSKVVPQLHTLVTGPLKGQVRLHLRPFPIRGHAGSVEGGLALMAAARLGKLWPFVLQLYDRFDQFAVDRLPAWAEAAGLERARFKQLMGQAQTRKQLVRSKKEGLRNGVKATPTLFINGRHYLGALDRATLLDVLQEEADRLAKRTHCGG